MTSCRSEEAETARERMAHTDEQGICAVTASPEGPKVPCSRLVTV